MIQDLAQAVMIAGVLVTGAHEDVPVQDRDICVIERPIAVIAQVYHDYEIWMFESGVRICKRRETRFAGPTTDDETIKQILIGGSGTGGK